MNAKRRILLINPKFQLRFAFFVCSWIFVLSLIYPVVIYNLLEFFARYSAEHSMAQAVVNLERIKGDLIILLCSFQLLFLGVTFLISIFLSHRIAGPLWRLLQVFQEARHGNFRANVKFRTADNFQELASEYNLLAGHLGQVLDSAEKALRPIGDTDGEAKEAIRSIQALRSAEKAKHAPVGAAAG